MSMKEKGVAAASQIKRQQTWKEVWTIRIIKGWVSDAKLKSFRQQSARDLASKLCVVSTLHVRDVCLDADMVQPPRFPECQRLIRKRIGAGEILDRVKTVEWVDRQHRSWTEDMHISRGDIQGMNRLSLVLPQILLIKF